MIAGDFKKKTTLSQRKEEAENILAKYPERIPVIIERGVNCDLALLDKHKYLVPMDITIYHLQYIIRKRIKLKDTQALYFFVNGAIIKPQEFVSQVFQ